MNRAGYLQWRNHLKQHHAKLAGAIMARCGYGDVEIARVQSLLRKENLKRDTEAQAIEDVVHAGGLAACFSAEDRTVGWAVFATTNGRAQNAPSTP